MLEPDAERLRMAFDLHEAGVDLQRQRLKRAHPELDARAVERLLIAWLHREGEPGDAPGHEVDGEERRRWRARGRR